MLALVGHGALLAAEGWMLASGNAKDRSFLGKTYFVFSCVAPLAMTGEIIKSHFFQFSSVASAVKPAGGEIVDLWKVFALFQLSRLVSIRSRLTWRLRREIRKPEEMNLQSQL